MHENDSHGIQNVVVYMHALQLIMHDTTVFWSVFIKLYLPFIRPENVHLGFDRKNLGNFGRFLRVVVFLGRKINDIAAEHIDLQTNFKRKT